MKIKKKNGVIISVVCASLLGFTVVGEAASVRTIVKNFYQSSFGSDSSKGTFVNGTRYSSVYDNGTVGFIPVSWLKSAGMTIQDLNSSKNKVTISNPYIDKYNSAKTERDNLTKQVTSLTNQVNTFKSENTSLKNQLNNLQNTLNTTITERDSLKSQVATLNTLITNLQNALNSTSAERDSLKSQNTTLNNQVNDLRNTLNSTITDRNSLILQVTQLNNQITNLQNTLNSTNAERDSLKTQNAALTNQVADLQNTLNGNVSDGLQKVIDGYISNSPMYQWHIKTNDSFSNGFLGLDRFGNSIRLAPNSYYNGYNNTYYTYSIFDLNGNIIQTINPTDSKFIVINNLNNIGIIVAKNPTYPDSVPSCLLINRN
ncbi:hypothetical protein HPK19_03140 [Arthrobacter citreus]|nr:hypothetical protein HPK19_03140 [Arthrobacter citreus]